MLLKATMPKTHKAGGAGRLYTINIDGRLSPSLMNQTFFAQALINWRL